MSTKAHYKIRARDIIKNLKKAATIEITEARNINISRGNPVTEVVMGVTLCIGDDDIYDLNGDPLSDEEKDTLVEEIKAIIDEHNAAIVNEE